MTLKAIHAFRIPGWLATLIAVVAVALTLVADRVALAAQVSRADVRIQSLEIQHVEMRATDKEILAALERLETGQQSEAIAVQRIADRQDEVRRVLRIVP